MFKNAKAVFLLVGTSLLSVLSIAQAPDRYEAEIILAERSKAGLILSSKKEIYAQLLVKRNHAEILRLPVFASEKSIGATAGLFFAVSGNYDSLPIQGVTATTKISDFMSAFKGTSKGMAVVIPGPCCLGFGFEKLKAANDKGLSFATEIKTGGLMLDYSKITLQIAPNKTLNERREYQDQTLAQLADLPYSKEPGKAALIGLDCKEEGEGDSHFIQVNNFHEIKHVVINLNPLDFYTAKTAALKPSIAGDKLVLYPEKINSQIKGERFDIDLASESAVAKDFFGREWSYQALMITANKSVNLSCLSKTSLQKNLPKFEKYVKTLWQN